MKPLYIWAGGKRKLITQYLKNPGIPTTGFDTFVEPFFGGGAMMIWVSENCPDVKHYVMNDIKEEIVGIYTAIRNDVDNFTNRMDNLQSQYMPLEKADRKKFYYDLREEYTQNWKQWNRTEEAATLYFLMKTAFNGIWQETKTSNGRFATPCGLLNQKDEVYDKGNVLEWHDFLQKVTIYCGDWHDACKNIISKKAFYFMDPPYRDSFTQYGEGFSDSDQEKLIDFCKDKAVNGDIVFYCNKRDDVSDTFFDDRKGNLEISLYNITHTAGRRKKNDDGSHSAKKTEEILLHNYYQCQRDIPIKETQEIFNGLFE